MSPAELVINAGQLVLEVGEEFRPVSAAQIREIVGNEQSIVDGLTVPRPESDQIRQIAFMERTLPVGVIATSDGSTIHLKAFVKLLGEIHPVENSADHLLINSQWYQIDSSTGDEVRSWIEEISVENTLNITEYPLIYRGGVREFEFIDEVDFSEFQAAAEAYLIPAGLKADLFDYQKTGYGWLTAASRAGIGCILGDEMGLGKTLQVIAVITDHLEHGSRSSIVIAPVTLLENWAREIFKFAPHVKIYRHLGADRVRYAGALEDVDVLLTSYETAVNDLGLLKMVEWDLMVLDEAQQVKNPGTRRARSLRQLRRNSTIAVTGTPLENSALDIWSLSEFAVPGYLGPQSSFNSIATNEPDWVAAALKPIMIRREVVDVADDLPEKNEYEIVLKMFDHEMHGYQELIKELREKNGSANPLGTLTRLRQFTAHPGALDTTQLADPMMASAKFTRLIEMLTEVFASNQKALVFSAFTATSDLIAGHIKSQHGVPSLILDGRIPTTDRQSMVDEFSAIDGPAVLVINPSTGGAGLNITAANHVFHYTLEWNPAKESQATARSFRRGQELPVFVYRFYYTESLDELILRTLHAKIGLSKDIVLPSDNIEIELVTNALGI